MAALRPSGSRSAAAQSYCNSMYRHDVCFADGVIHQFWWQVPVTKATCTSFIGMVCTPGVDAEAEAKAKEFMAKEEHEPLGMGWRSSAIAVKLATGGLFLFDCWLTDDEHGAALQKDLAELGEVKLVYVAAAHMDGVVAFQQQYPNAIYVVDPAFAATKSDERHPSLRVDAVLGNSREGLPEAAAAILEDFDWHCGTYWTSFLHKPTRTFIGGDAVYKSSDKCVGPGSAKQPALTPPWMATLYQQSLMDPCKASCGFLPTYSLGLPKEGVVLDLAKWRSWSFDRMVCSHITPVSTRPGELQAGELEGEALGPLEILEASWGWAEKDGTGPAAAAA